MAQASSKKTKSKTKAKTRIALKRKTKIPKRKAVKKSKPLKKTKKKVKAKTTRVHATRLEIVKTTVAAANATSQISRVGVGDIAPAFTLNDQNGNSVSLSQFSGKRVLLYFYPRDDTPGCTKEACSFRDNLPIFEGADAVILGVSFDGQDAHQKFIAKYQLNFTLLSDLTKAVANAYGVYVQKNMYGNISMGIERSTFLIDRAGRIANAWRKVSVDGHTQEVLEALSKIQ